MVDWKYSFFLFFWTWWTGSIVALSFFLGVFSLKFGPEQISQNHNNMEGAADPEFMELLKTLKWTKDEKFIATPEYEKRKTVLFDTHFGQPEAPTRAGARPPKKKTSTASDEDETSSDNNSADDAKATSAGSKKRSPQTKEAIKVTASRKKKKRLAKTATVDEQMEEYCVTVLWVHNADFTGKAEKLEIPYKYDRVACSGCVAQPALHRFPDKGGKVVPQWLQLAGGTWECAVCQKKSKTKGATFDPLLPQRIATKMMHNTYREHIQGIMKVAKIDDELLPLAWGPAHRNSDGGYLAAAMEYDSQSLEERQGQPHLTSPHTTHLTLKCRERPV